MSCQEQHNGRVNIMSPDTNALFVMKDKIHTGGVTWPPTKAMTGNWYDTKLSDAFFSGQNIQALQNGLRAGVYKRSNKQYLIGEQNSDELKIVMRSIFLQYSRNEVENIPSQIAALNRLVLDYAVGQVYGEVEGYMKYKQDASTMYQPIAPPVMSNVNDKQLEFKKWF